MIPDAAFKVLEQSVLAGVVVLQVVVIGWLLRRSAYLVRKVVDLADSRIEERSAANEDRRKINQALELIAGKIERSRQRGRDED